MEITEKDALFNSLVDISIFIYALAAANQGHDWLAISIMAVFTFIVITIIFGFFWYI